MKEGVTGSAFIFARASRKVAATSLFASLLNPMWLSLDLDEVEFSGVDAAVTFRDLVTFVNEECLRSWTRGRPSRPRPCI